MTDDDTVAYDTLPVRVMARRLIEAATRLAEIAAGPAADLTRPSYIKLHRNLVARTIGIAIADGTLERSASGPRPEAIADRVRHIDTDARWIARCIAPLIGIDTRQAAFAPALEIFEQDVAETAIAFAAARGDLPLPPLGPARAGR